MMSASWILAHCALAFACHSRATLAYDNYGRRIGVARTGADSIAYQYDPASRLQTLGHKYTTPANNVDLGFAYNPGDCQ